MAVSAFYFKFDLAIRQFALGDVDWHLALGDMLVQQWQVGQEVSQIAVRDGLLEGRSGCVPAPFGGQQGVICRVENRNPTYIKNGKAGFSDKSGLHFFLILRF